MNNNFNFNQKIDNQALMNLQVLNMLSIDMQDLINKYVLDSLVSKYTTKSVWDVERPSAAAVLPILNSLFSQPKRNLFAPIPRYADSVQSNEKDDNRDRSASFSTTKDLVNLTSPGESRITSPQKSSEDDQTPTRRRIFVQKSKQQLRKIKMDLAFENETGELSTRCDVVYKTILRDFRRFFLDNFKVFKMNQDQSVSLVEALFQFTLNLFSDKSLKLCKEISLDLGCLLFPKEMIKEKEAMADIERTNHFGVERDEIKNEIMRIHGFLYKFSIDKIEECFQNTSLCTIFLNYVDSTRESRIRSNPTMSKNSSIYLKARTILEDKAVKSLSD